jgi:hypothetical protein
MAPQPQQRQEPRILRIFISYASEDLNIALAIARALNDTLPETFVEVCFDKWFLQAGEEFKKELEAKLEKTDILIIVYTGVGKQSHSFTGWEVGFFDRVRQNDSTRKVVPFFLESPPASASEFQGCSLKISPELLQLTSDEFSAQNVVDPDDPICVFIRDLQDQAREIKEEAGYPKGGGHEKCEPAVCVKNMRLAVFSYLKTTVEAIIKPQKQITIKTTGAALQQSETDLPAAARLVPIGGSPMSIFGLNDEEMTWEKFLLLTAGPHQDSWREAITSVIISSQAERIDVDNSQVILSSDESKTYRIVLTTATKYWNDNREFNLYFVETLKREDYGDRDTTLMLKGLEVVCRYRFMFLEDDSPFSAGSLTVTSEERFPEIAAKLLRELNLIKKESSSAGLDQPRFWKQFVDWTLIGAMGEAFRPRERNIRELISQVLIARDQKLALTALKQQLATAVGELEDATRSHNSNLVEAMARKLQLMVQTKAP